MSAHTPGPWVVSSVGIGFEVDDRDGNQVAQASQRLSDGRGRSHFPERQANGRLIAAAPDLLAALETIVERYRGSGPVSTDDLARAAHAIAKARGTP